MTVPLPAHKVVRDLFADLLGRPVTVASGQPLLLNDVAKSLVAVYTDDAKRMAAVVGLDLPLTAFAGAALGLLPPGGAQDCVADGVITPAMEENVREVCNVLASVLNREGHPHIKLASVAAPGDEPPADAKALLLALGSRLDLDVEVGGYGKGRFSMRLAD